MRISTAQIFGNGIAAIQRGQAGLARTQEQLSTGKRILRPSDDPGGAVQSLKLRERVAAVEQYARNGTLAANRLQQEETVLAQVGNALQRVRELTVQAANATQTNESRAAIARELTQILGGLIDAANAQDSGGEYLFAGFRSQSRPFVRNAAGEVEYLGDLGQRFVSIAPDSRIAVGDSGGAFMTIPRGNGLFIVAPDAGNAGTGTVHAAETVDPTAIGTESYTILMTAPDAYDVLDESAVVVASGAFAAGQAIDIDGRRIVLAGEPAAGDRFEVAPAGVVSVFEIVDDLAVALETPRNDGASRAQLNYATTAALENLDQALGRVLGIRTEIGARLNRIESRGVAGEEQSVQLHAALSAVEDLDYAEAISRFSLQQAALDAAQQTYVQAGRLSLFDYIR